MKKVYLAGPMRGIPEYNFPAFLAAARDLRHKGYEVLSPAEADLEEDAETTKLTEAEATAKFRHFMTRDMRMVLESEGVAVLPGWENSTGALMEVFVGKMAGGQIIDALTEKPIPTADIYSAVGARLRKIGLEEVTHAKA